MQLKDFLLKETEGNNKFMGEVSLGKLQSIEDIGRRKAEGVYVRPYNSSIDLGKQYKKDKLDNRTNTMAIFTISDEGALKKFGNDFKIKDTSAIEKMEYINPKTGKLQAAKLPEKDKPYKGDASEVQGGLKIGKKARERWSGKNEN